MANEAGGGAEQHFDILIRGGNVFDGLGAAAVRADVGIIGERIASVGDLTNAEAGRTIDAAGAFRCAGDLLTFIPIPTSPRFMTAGRPARLAWG